MTAGARLVAIALIALAAACGTTTDLRSAPQGGGQVTGPAPMDGLGAPASDVVGSVDGTGRPAGVMPAAAPGGSAPLPAASAASSGVPLPMDGARTAEEGPVKIGLIYTYNDDAAASAGVDNGNTFTPRAAFDAMVQAYNERGGVAGRRIVPVAVELSSSSTALEADLQAACDRFTTDERVAVVLSSIGLFSETFSQCLAKAGTPQLSGDYSLGDEQALAAVPTLLAVSTLTVDDRGTVLLKQMTSVGRLDRTHQLGVVVEGCPHNQRAFSRTMQPLAKRLGVPVAESAETRCFEDVGDLGGLASDMQNAVLRFQTRGITHVAFVSGSVEGNAMFLFATAAETQGYRPTYLLTSAVVPAVQETNTPKSQLAKAFGVGWLPSVDTSRSSLTGPAGRRCLADLRSGAGLTPQSPADRYYAASTCDLFALYDALLRVTAGATGAPEVLAGADHLGSSFEVAAAYGEATDFRDGRRTGVARARVFAWSGECGCFDYTGQPFSVVVS